MDRCLLWLAGVLAAAASLMVVSTLRADDLPAGVVNTQNPRDVSLTPAQSLQRIQVPVGFRVTLFAGEPDVRRPIAFDFDDRGRLWVVENYSHPTWRPEGRSDRIVILEDRDHDGRFDRRTVFWDKGRYLTGICLGHGGVWICNTPALSFLPDRDRDDRPDSEPVDVLDGFQKSSNNVVNNLHWGPDGWLYGAIGLSSPSRVGPPGSSAAERTRITRGIWRYHPTRKQFEVVAEGMVNPWGADFNAVGDLFTTNTVIAHLWHIVPGMYCQRRGVEQDNRFAYERIQSITDHLHWGGGTWQRSRKSEARHSVAGGGHAHCGAMIYLGDNWPASYRGDFFTANLHGNRVNRDRLTPSQSTYRGVHGNDVLLTNDPWFRGLSVKYGPDGGVYVSDWHDFGECHDKDGSHRSSGRIYKVVFGQPEARSPDLQGLSDLRLAQLHGHVNEWYVRRARRILQERAAAGNKLAAARLHLRQMFASENDPVRRLRALWTRHVIGDLSMAQGLALLSSRDEHVRRWAVRLLVDRAPAPGSVAQRLAELAADEPSPKVRLELASALQRIPIATRGPLAAGLARHAEDAEDPYLPLMIWYGLEPLAAADGAAALRVALGGRLPRLRQFVARRLLDGADSPAAVRASAELLTAAALGIRDAGSREDLMEGMLAALERRGIRTAPPSWTPLYREIQDAKEPSLRATAVRLATVFGDARAVAALRERIRDPKQPLATRRAALQALLPLPAGVPTRLLHELAAGKASPLRREAIRGLVLQQGPRTAQVLLDAYGRLSREEQQDALTVLCSRRSFAAALLVAIEQGKVPRRHVTAFSLQQLRAFRDPMIRKRVQRLWADRDEQLAKAEQIARYRRIMTPAFVRQGDPRAGRLLFEKTCARCHTLFGEGARVGPDLTGSGRKSIDYLLSNLLDPSAIVDPAYRLTRVRTADGRVLSGFMIQHTERAVLLRTEHARVRLAMDDIEELKTASISMMPEGMLTQYTDTQVRDLLRYLTSPRQVPLPERPADPVEKP